MIGVRVLLVTIAAFVLLMRVHVQAAQAVSQTDGMYTDKDQVDYIE